MERDILSQVIEAEKEIQQCLDRERIKSREWLERIKKECEEEYRKEEQRITASLERSMAEAVSEAEAKAAGIISRAAGQTERLGHVQAGILSRIVAKQINRILPG